MRLFAKVKAMRRFSTVFLILLISVAAVFAANSQKIYSVDTDIYRTISQIYVLTGHALPSATGPWSADELLSMYEVIDRNDVPTYMQQKYDNALAELTAKRSSEFKNGAMEFSGTIDTELYVHTYDVKAADAYSRTDVNGLADHAFEGRSWWFAKDLNHITPFFKLEWETWLTDHFYTDFEFGLQNAFRGNEYGELGSTKLNSNIPMLQNFSFNLKVLDIASFPHKALAALGGNGWSFEAGRDRLSWGHGTTGNLMMSDNLPYHDMVRFTAYGEKFKYTYLISFFPSKKNYYRSDATGFAGTGDNNSTRTLDGLAFLSSHRFEFRMFGDKVSFILTEGLAYISETNSIQFAALSPMFFMHNAFMPNNSNSTLDFELNWTPVRGLTLYGQILLDQFTMPGFEDPIGPGKDYSSSPNGTGYLAGLKFLTGVKDGLLTINPEIAYVSPFCYVRDGVNNNYGMDYTGAIRSRLYAYEDRGLSTDILYEDYVLGYKYGPDCLVANLAASWEGGKLNIRANGMFIAHGTHDLWTKWTKIPAHTSEEDYKAQYSGVTTSHAASDNYRYADAKTARNARWYTLDIGAGADYRILDNLSLSLDVDYIYMRNIFNIGGQNASDVQIVFGLSWQCF